MLRMKVERTDPEKKKMAKRNQNLKKKEDFIKKDKMLRMKVERTDPEKKNDEKKPKLKKNVEE